MAKFFNIPFCSSGTRGTIPDSDQINMSWSSGYTANYEYNPVTNDQAKHIERDKMNTLFYEITSTIQQLQLNGIAPYYESVISEKGPKYSLGAIISYGGELWKSKINNNNVIPNANSTDNWEIVYGYDNLIKQLKKDGYLSENDSGNENSYTKSEIDNKLTELKKYIDNTLLSYLEKELGEIYLLTWCNEDRNTDGFFLCNGDKLPFDPDEENIDENPLLFYGNQLYDLCYIEDDTGENLTESDFKKRWDIQIDTVNKTIQLPNILGNSGSNYLSDTQTVSVTLGRESKIPVFDDFKSTKTFSNEFTNEETAKNAGVIVYPLAMLPCVYLGVSEIIEE